MEKIIIVIFFATFLGYNNAHTVSENFGLPEIYGMDDYSRCKTENGLYCRFKFQLYPNPSDNPVWQMIESRKKTYFAYRRDLYYRYRCLPINLQGRPREILSFVTREENRKFENVSLSVHVENMKCKEFSNFSLTKSDKIFVYVIFSYIVFVVVITIFHNRIQNSKDEYILKASKYTNCFSMKTNWNKFLEPILYPDYVRLKSFQGLKTICMFGVIFGHTKMTLENLFSKNPEFYEEVFSFPLNQFFLNFGMHFVQIYFLISAWLFANNVFPLLFVKNAVNRLSFLLRIFVRYCRLIGPLGLVVFLSRTNLYKVFRSGPQDSAVDLTHEACNKNAWPTILLVSNHYYFVNQCYVTAWHISADFQLFLSTLVLVYIIAKYKLNEKRCIQLLSVVFGISWIYNASVIYLNRLPVSFGVSPEKTKFENLFSSYESFAIYSSVYANIGGYCVGLVAGSIYSKIKDKNIRNTKLLFNYGLLAPLMIFLTIYDYSPMVSAIIGASMKPLFNVGIACFIMGVAFSNENSVLKRILECKYFLYLSKLNYSVYIVHYWTTFCQEILFEEMIEHSYMKLISVFVVDALLALLFGFMVFILFECPVQRLLGVLLNKSASKYDKKFNTE